MEQSTTEEDLHSGFTEMEIEVAEILLNLEYLISESEYKGCWPLMWRRGNRRLVWGVLKKRSSVVSSRIPAASPAAEQGSRNDRDTKTSTEVNKVEAPSPSTPLSFSPSTESDDRFKSCPRKNSKKRSREEFLKTLQELTDNRIALQGELERVKKHYDEVLAFNRDLKAMKKQMIDHKREEPNLEINRSHNLGMNLGNPQHRHHQPPPSPADPRAAELLLLQTRDPSFLHHYFQQSQKQQQPAEPPFHHHHQQHQFPYGQPLFSSNGGLGGAKPSGLLNSSSSLPDLNVSVEEAFGPLDYSRALAMAEQRARYAEARRERQMKRKVKQPKK